MSEALTPAESVRLVELERVISTNVTIVGEALQEIRDQRLYRAAHSTFEAYCDARFGMGRNYINRQIRAAEVIKNLVPIGTILPATESQARPLSTLPADQQPVAWEKAVEKAAEEGKSVAARHVEEAVAEVYPTPHHGELSREAEAKGAEAERDTENLWLLKSTWRKATKKDRSAFMEWVETTNNK